MLSLCINLIIRKLDDSLKLKTNHEKKCETIEFINENGEFVLRSDKCSWLTLADSPQQTYILHHGSSTDLVVIADD